MKKSSLVILLAIFLIPEFSFSATELTVYTSRKEHLIKDIFKSYEKKSGIKIKYKTGKAGALIQALDAESKKPSADILMTVDAGNLWQASKKDLLEKSHSKVLEKNVPSHLRDDQNKWFGLSVRARTTVVNTNTYKGEELSYEGLAEKKWKGKLCLRTSKKVYNQSLIAMLIDQHGYQKAKKIVSGWVSNTVDIYSNDTAVLEAVAAGQCVVGIVNTYYLGRLMNQKPKLPLKIVWPNQDSTGVHVNVSGAGIVRNSKNKKEALKFLEWLSSREAQNSFAQINMEFPILANAPLSETVKNWGDFKANDQFKLTKSGEFQEDAIKLALEVGYK